LPKARIRPTIALRACSISHTANFFALSMINFTKLRSALNILFTALRMALISALALDLTQPQKPPDSFFASFFFASASAVLAFFSASASASALSSFSLA